MTCDNRFVLVGICDVCLRVCVCVCVCVSLLLFLLGSLRGPTHVIIVLVLMWVVLRWQWCLSCFYFRLQFREYTRYR